MVRVVEASVLLSGRNVCTTSMRGARAQVWCVCEGNSARACGCEARDAGEVRGVRRAQVRCGCEGKGAGVCGCEARDAGEAQARACVRTVDRNERVRMRWGVRSAVELELGLLTMSHNAV
jgi:hypothetical protein